MAFLRPKFPEGKDYVCVLVIFFFAIKTCPVYVQIPTLETVLGLRKAFAASKGLAGGKYKRWDKAVVSSHSTG